MLEEGRDCRESSPTRRREQSPRPGRLRHGCEATCGSAPPTPKPTTSRPRPNSREQLPSPSPDPPKGTISVIRADLVHRTQSPRTTGRATYRRRAREIRRYDGGHVPGAEMDPHVVGAVCAATTSTPQHPRHHLPDWQPFGQVVVAVTRASAPSTSMAALNVAAQRFPIVTTGDPVHS